MSAQVAEIQPIVTVIPDDEPLRPVETPTEEVKEAANDEVKDEKEETADTEEGQERDEKGKFKPKHGVQERIDELTRKAGEKEREAAYWRGVAEAAKPKEPEQAKADPGKPKAEVYATYDEYIDALTDWKIDQREAKRDADTKAGAQATTWQTRAAEAKATTMPDFDAVLDASTAPMTRVMAEVIRESEHGPALAYHLAKNPEAAQKLIGLSPLAQARELGRIEATLSAPKAQPAAPKRVTSAPTPPSTVGAGRSTEGDPSTMSMDDYMAWRKGALKESR